LISGQDSLNTIRGDVFVSTIMALVTDRRETSWQLNIIATNLVRDGQRAFRVAAIPVGIDPAVRFVTSAQLGPNGLWSADDSFPGVPTGDEHRLLQVQMVRRGGSQAQVRQRLEVDFWRERDGVLDFDRPSDLRIKYDFRLR
jgi:hypothetical protein